MTYQFYKTNEIPEAILESYMAAFNAIFDKNFSKDFFLNKYANVSKTYSYHSFMVHENQVVGACTFIPYEYKFKNKALSFGLGVDVFVNAEHRKNVMALYQMYSQIKDVMINDGVAFNFAIPNINSYPFWVKILKWESIGDLPYYVLPLRFGKVLAKFTQFDGFTHFLMNKLQHIGRLFSFLVHQKAPLASIHIDGDQRNLKAHRFFENYEKQSNFTYKIYDEEGVKTAYLLDFHGPDGIKDNRSLANAVYHMSNNEKIDLIIYVGKISFPQISLIKLPKNKEPKRLPFIGEILNEDKVDKDIFDFNNWDIGLFNYDVR